MRESRKPKVQREKPALCVAVRRIREIAGWSQERMAQETGIASQTISRFELGKQVPRDSKVLMKLREAAADAGLDAESQLFNDALNEQSGDWPSAEPGATMTPNFYTPRQWRLMQIGKIAAVFSPDIAASMEQAGGPFTALVDEVIAAAPTGGPMDSDFYYRLENRVYELATQRAFQILKKEGKP
jgi:transcriptional regulator with XRE-family HTH domain